MKLLMEIKQVKARKTVSLDMVYTITLETNQSELLDLGKLPSDQIVEVEIKQEENV